jgi:hypothetical protein
VRSTFVISASNQTTAAARSGSGGAPSPGTNGSADGRKSSPTLRPPLAAISSWISGSGAPEVRVEVDQDDLRNVEAERAAELPGDELGDERARALARAAELQDVQAVVVGLDEARHRPALAQGRDVARGRHRARSRRRGRAVAHAATIEVVRRRTRAGIVAPMANPTSLAR